MSFPTTPLLDAFNRTNEGPPPSSNWSSMYAGMTGQWEVYSNQCRVDSLGTYSIGAGNSWNPSIFTPNVEGYATIITKPNTGTSFGVLVKTANPNTTTPNGYSIITETLAGTDEIRLTRTDNGVNTVLATYNGEFSNGDSVGIRIVGSYMEGWYKTAAGLWTRILTATDATYTAAGSLCIVSTGAATIIENVGGGSFIIPQTRLARGEY